MLSARAPTFQFPEGQRAEIGAFLGGSTVQRACRQQQVTPSGTRRHMTMINRLTQLANYMVLVKTEKKYQV